MSNERYERNGKVCSKTKSEIAGTIRYSDPNTFLWIFKELDMPYIDEDWKALCEKFKDRLIYSESANDPILGRYIAKMKLAATKDLTYVNSRNIPPLKVCIDSSDPLIGTSGTLTINGDPNTIFTVTMDSIPTVTMDEINDYSNAIKSLTSTPCTITMDENTDYSNMIKKLSSDTSWILTENGNKVTWDDSYSWSKIYGDISKNWTTTNTTWRY